LNPIKVSIYRPGSEPRTEITTVAEAGWIDLRVYDFCIGTSWDY